MWNLIEAEYQYALGQQKKYIQFNKSANVPWGYIDSDDFKLGNWVANRRGDYKKGNLDKYKVLELESLPGLVWSKYRMEISSS